MVKAQRSEGLSRWELLDSWFYSNFILTSWVNMLCINFSLSIFYKHLPSTLVPPQIQAWLSLSRQDMIWFVQKLGVTQLYSKKSKAMGWMFDVPIKFPIAITQTVCTTLTFHLGLSFPWIYALSPHTYTSPSPSLFPDLMNINWERDNTWFVHWHAIFQLHTLNN